MTLIDLIQELQDQGLTEEQILKDQRVIDLKRETAEPDFQTAAAPKDANVVAPGKASETQNTESQSEDGSSELPKFRSINDVDIFNKKKVDELKIKKLDPNNFEVVKPELFTRIGLELRKEELKKEKELRKLKEKEKDLYLDAKKQI